MLTARGVVLNKMFLIRRVVRIVTRRGINESVMCRLGVWERRSARYKLKARGISISQ